MDDQFWQLPGPVRFLQAVGASHHQEACTVVAVPGSAHPPELIQQLESAAGHRNAITVPLPPGLGGPVLDFLLSKVAGRLPAGSLDVVDLVEHEYLRYALLLVDARRADESSLSQLAALAGHFAAAVRAVSNVEARPLLCTILPGNAPDAIPTPDSRLHVHWWWGCIDRLDTALHVRRLSLPMPIPTLREQAIIELAAFDLTLAGHLALTWDGETCSLPDLLDGYGKQRPTMLDWGRPSSAESIERPPAADLDAWAAGACERWGDGPPRWHVCPAQRVETDALRQLQWRAQIALMMPMIDEQRVRLLRWLDGRGHANAIRQLRDPPEVGDLTYYLINNSALRQNRSRLDLARWLQSIRNRLVHLELVSEAELEKGRALIADAQD